MFIFTVKFFRAKNVLNIKNIILLVYKFEDKVKFEVDILDFIHLYVFDLIYITAL